jgi:DNA-binding transcriptional LysR family regulator
MQNISIKKMRVMLAAVEEGSFTKASAKQNITQPATTIIIQDIEDHAGCELFERSGMSRKAVLTDAGEEVASVFMRIVGEFDSEISRVKDLLRGRKEAKEILIQNSYSSALSAPWLHSLFKTFDGCYIKFNSCSREEIIERIQSRDACLGLIDGQKSCEMSDYRHIASDHIVAVTRSDKEGSIRKCTWNQMPNDCIIYSGTNNVTFKAMRQLLDNVGEKSQHLEINDEQLIASLVRETGMTAIMPRVTAQSILEDGDLACTEINGLRIEVPIGLIMPWGNMHKTNFLSLRGETVFPELMS